MRASRLSADGLVRPNLRTRFTAFVGSPRRLPINPSLVGAAFSAAFLSPQAIAAQTSAPGASTSASGMLMLQVLLGLIVVLAAIVATAWLLRRLGVSQMRGNAAMRVVGAVAVGPRERVILVEIRDTWLILGVAPGRVNTVHQMAKPLDADSATDIAPQPLDFKARLKQFMHTRAPQSK